MATNINFKYPNFCLGPVAGTFCSINQDDASTIMRIKNSAGSLIADYSLSSNIINELIHLEYVGPSDVTALMDGMTFFTVEKVSSTRCIIKRYEMGTSSNQLNLKHQEVIYTTGSFYYDIRAAAIEHYERTFDLHNPGGVNTLEISSTSRLIVGTDLFLGPSNDADNPGAGESVVVTNIVGNTITVSPNLTYQYVIGDQISFYTYAYLISDLGAYGDTSRGNIFKIDPDNGSVEENNTGKVYKNIDAARWCVPTETIASLAGDNMLFINPYASYYNWRSVYLNNLESDNGDSTPIYDVVFEDQVDVPIYLLTTKKTTRDDDGNRSTEDWLGWYNYTENTLTPYTNSIEVYTDDSKLIGQLQDTTIYAKVIDQYGVGLSGKTVNFAIVSGDFAVEFTPLNGQVTTDINGETSVGYKSGESYAGRTIVSCKTDGSSAVSTGSEFVWNWISIYTDLEYVAHDDPSDTKLYLIYTVTSGISGDVLTFAVPSGISSEGMMITRSFFTNPGGDWAQGGAGTSQVSTYLPDLIVGPGEGPIYTFTAPDPPGPGFDPMPNTIHQVEEFESELLTYYLPASGVSPDGFKFLTEWEAGAYKYEEPYVIMQQIIEDYDLQISQLKLSAHTYWVGSTPYDYVWTDTTLDQFIFVEDAVPAFWSVKNPRETNIWIQLRPYAYSLNVATVKMFVREVWWAGDTGYVDVSSQLTIETFDAGGEIFGLELTYNPAQDFHHNSIVYVFIEVYDMAPSPNRITTSYWFEVVPDYKAPYLENLNPGREEDNVAVDTDIYFEIKDDGAGVDIDTLELFINSRIVTPTTIVKESDNYYKVTYIPTTNFFFNKRIAVGVIVDDLTDYDNYLNDRYTFYTPESDEIFFTAFMPGACKRGLARFTDVSFLALGIGSGIDRDTLRLQVREKDVTDQSTIVPVIYRVS